MNNLYQYKAFGLTINSEFMIPQLPRIQFDGTHDIVILKKDLSELDIKNEHYWVNANEILFSLSDVGKFHITNGNCLRCDPVGKCSNSHLSVYIMGSGMGAVLHQRGHMLLHGSCVTDGISSILFVGDSGAGKSTLAAEFLSYGWKLLTDDVAAIVDIETTPMVQASYPSQKLWQDSIERYKKTDEDIHSLYTRENRAKFGVNVSEYFYDGCCPLRLIVRLLPTDEVCSITPIDGMAKLDQLMRNTYRSYMIAPQNRERHFRRCADLAGRIPMVLVTRQNGVQCANKLYEMITNYLGEKNNG